MKTERESSGRFRSGAPSPNPKGRPKKARGVDAAVIAALAAMVPVTEGGRRKLKSKLDITAAQIANKGANGDLRAAKMLLDHGRKAEERAGAENVGAAPMTETDHEIAARVVARIKQIIDAGGSHGTSEI